LRKEVTVRRTALTSHRPLAIFIAWQGDVDMIAVIGAVLQAEAHRDIDLPFRADHGHALLYDADRTFQPGNTLLGRFRGLTELRSIIAALGSIPK
jgi:mannonate dehydratase